MALRQKLNYWEIANSHCKESIRLQITYRRDSNTPPWRHSLSRNLQVNVLITWWEKGHSLSRNYVGGGIGNNKGVVGKLISISEHREPARSSWEKSWGSKIECTKDAQGRSIFRSEFHFQMGALNEKNLITDLVETLVW